jgi:8-oxo-dGTP pyrophosphatase MutT (NUDIX family)
MLLFKPDLPGIHLMPTIRDARALAERVFVVNGRHVEGLRARSVGFTADVVPPEAILNADPYRPIRRVKAAGGYVIRWGGKSPEVLLIFRNGVWDLPKGKRDRGEPLRETARREVREEVGIRRLRIRRYLGATLHAYTEKQFCAIKRTAWYWMDTPQTTFTPQLEEHIQEVAYVPWAEALERLHFPTLKTHMKLISPLILSRYAAR